MNNDTMPVKYDRPTRPLAPEWSDALVESSRNFGAPKPASFDYYDSEAEVEFGTWVDLEL